MSDILADTPAELASLPLIYRGKVRDVYGIDDQHILMVASDRLSAFDVVLPTGIPGKGATLTTISNFWFARLRHIIRNHLDLATVTLEQALPDPAERARVAGRAVVARKLRGLPIEAIVRGYIIGSGWKDYQQTGSICGIALPSGLKLADKLPAPIFTPSTKAAVGDHDENITFETSATLIGEAAAVQLRDATLSIYRAAQRIAAERGILLADTKLEFGRAGAAPGDAIVLGDEVLTPDSSRFWDAKLWRPGAAQPSFDKQFVRDWLRKASGWDPRTEPQAPPLPPEIVAATARRYQEAYRRLTGDEIYLD